MSDKSGIEWTDATWNPTTGCDRVSPGCAHCYALDLAGRLKVMGAPAYQNDGDPKTSGPGFALTLHPDRLVLPMRWSRPRRIFVNSMSDLFHPAVPDDYIDDVFAVMAVAPQHQFQILTKRPDRMRAYMTAATGGYQEAGVWIADEWRRDAIAHAGYHLAGRLWFDGGGKRIAALEKLQDGMTWPIPNVLLGTSIENDHWTKRADDLRETPAAVRFLSCEPLLGPLPSLNLEGIDWVIVGGESGPDYRPVDPAWVREIRDRCVDAGVAFFFKQWGGRTPKSGGRTLDLRTWDEMPKVPA
jgi:protein gp37